MRFGLQHSEVLGHRNRSIRRSIEGVRTEVTLPHF